MFSHFLAALHSDYFGYLFTYLDLVMAVLLQPVCWPLSDQQRHCHSSKHFLKDIHTFLPLKYWVAFLSYDHLGLNFNKFTHSYLITNFCHFIFYTISFIYLVVIAYMYHLPFNCLYIILFNMPGIIKKKFISLYRL